MMALDFQPHGLLNETFALRPRIPDGDNTGKRADVTKETSGDE